MSSQFLKNKKIEHRRKIRDSCNNCSAQKIRCGKERPSCSRCSGKRLECNYSYSQRTGRRASSTNTQRDQQDTTSAQANANSPPATSDSGSLFGLSISMTPTMSPQMAQPSRYPADNLGESSIDMLDDASFLTTMSIDALASPTFEATAFSSSYNDAAGTADLLTSMDPTTAYEDTSSQWWDMPSGASTTTQGTVKPLPTPQVEQEQAARQPSDNAYQQGHDCMALALRAVYNLNVTREPCHIATSDPMASIQQSHNEVRDVDTVLFCNRDAAQTINKILHCSCSADPTVSLACYLATTKIVDWYGAAIGAATESSGDNERTNTSLDHSSLWGAMVDRITVRPIFMGRYRLDPEVQRAVRAQVVLSELKEHIQPLISRLPKYSVSGLSSGQDPSLRKDIHGGQSCILRNQLRAVIQAARSPTSTPDA